MATEGETNEIPDVATAARYAALQAAMEICREFAERARANDPDPDFRDHAINSARSIEYDIRDRLLGGTPLRDLLASLRGTSQIFIAAEWQDCISGHTRLYAEGTWVRRRAWPEPNGRSAVVHVQSMTPGPGWSHSIGFEKGGYRGGFTTAQEAQQAADALLRKRGWLLLDPERPPQPGTE